MTSLSPEKAEPTVQSHSILNASDEDLKRISAEGLLSLSIEEMRTIQSHFKNLNREPTDVELETIAQTWSEHCVHKTFKAAVVYEENPDANSGRALGSKNYSNLLKETIAKATEDLALPWCLSVFKDNAGIIEFDDKDGVAFKCETHNHPSALEPYGGAGTGLGGVIRDVLGCGLGAKPVMNTDVFCFGDLNTPSDQIPAGALSPRRIARGVVAGVRDYGNRMGIPTANGAIYFDRGYVGNPLVFCGTIGMIPKTMIDKTVNSGDLVVVMGGRTGRDGIHGATFSSAPLEGGITSNVVQIGHAIMEKKTMDVLLQARDKKLYRSITDCGAGGFSSAIGELGKDTGVEVNLEKAPLKYRGLKPWEIWLSESQERMVLAVPPENWNALNMLCQQENVEAVAIGKFTDDHKLTVKYDNQIVAQLDMHFLHDGIPKLHLNALWNASEHIKSFSDKDTGSPTKTFGDDKLRRDDIVGTLKALMAHPVIASKESVIRQYDHEVQGGSIIKPLMGSAKDAPTDGCVFRPKLESWKGVAVSNGLNPEMGKFDPFVMAQMAVDEAYRNLITVGGGLTHAAILDNFCWGNPKSSLELGGLVRAAEGAKEAALAYGLPFISGKDSFNNTWKSNDGALHSIPPTLLVSAIGVLDDVRTCVSPGLKEEGALLYVIGETTDKLAGSWAAKLWNESTAALPAVDLANAKTNYKKLQSAMKHRLILSAHDLSEGGLAVAAAEMAFGSQKGVEINIPVEGISAEVALFSETPSRILVEISPMHQNEFEQTMGARVASLVGKVTKSPTFVVKQGEKVLVQEQVASLKTLWKKSLENL